MFSSAFSINLNPMNNNFGKVSTAKKQPVELSTPKDVVSFSGSKPKETKWATDLSEKAQKDILKALNNLDKQKLLGHGADGNAYLVKNIDGFADGVVVKVSHTKPIDAEGKMQRVGVEFNTELETLSALPSSLTNSQKLVGYIKKADNSCCLVTTLAKGSKVNPQSNPITPKHLSSILNSFFELDKAGILHRDLKKENWFATESGDVNLLDYGEAVKFDVKETKQNSDNYNFPAFDTPSNLRSFEDTGLYPYLNDLSKTKGPQETRKIFTSYLQEKSNFHAKKAELLKEQVKAGNTDLKQAARYEALQAKLFKKPTDDLIDLESTKIQMTASAEGAYKQEILDKNPLANVTLKFFALINAKRFDLKVKEMQNRPQTTEMQEYLKMQEQLFKYRAKDKLEGWTQGLVGWLMMNITGENTQLHQEFLNKNIINFEIPDVASEIQKGKEAKEA